ncbi:hypothetical protein [Nocardia sp. R6R-6]|uniref:hypothetical protein n=1 Tax=Nocardia sp. R6R-6 TaxID=3459303 RepID=UPI00403E2CA9
MNWNERVRRLHGWLGMLLTVTVIITVVAVALRGPAWVSYLPLLPLVLLLFSGVYLLVVPYAIARRDRPAGGTSSRPAVVARSRLSAPRARQLHRWSAIVLIVTMLATVVALAQAEPVVWVSYLPLLPLALLLISGLYMFVLPYATKRRGVSPALSDHSAVRAAE